MRLIDADFVKRRIDETMSSDYVYSTSRIKSLIDEAPTIDAEPVKWDVFESTDNRIYEVIKQIRHQLDEEDEEQA